jgi:hypothetical protein
MFPNDIVEECCQEVGKLSYELGTFSTAGVPQEIMWQWAMAVSNTAISGAFDIVEFGSQSAFSVLIRKVLSKRNETPRITTVFKNSQDMTRCSSSMSGHTIIPLLIDRKALDIKNEFDHNRFDVIFAHDVVKRGDDNAKIIEEFGVVCKEQGRVTITFDYGYEHIDNSEIENKIIPSANNVGLILMSDKIDIRAHGQSSTSRSKMILYFKKVCLCARPNQKVAFVE